MSLVAAIAAWRKLADDELRLAEINKRYGDVSAFMVRAEIYERAAQALEIQERTGVAVCTCCHKPLGEGMKHGAYFH
ncbi:hypothetical protein [Ralstonia mannitolilytica]|uniref:hypothetical protein n=1 Tax=Ralstonia mannitolilytica TaxID=105219 RepID=UPI00374A4AD1